MSFVRLPLKNAYNARDLGGYPTTNGHVTKYQKFVRSDDVGRLDEEDIKFLQAYGVSAIIDLRGPAELAESPNPFANHPLINYLNVPLKPGDRGALHYVDRYRDIDRDYLKNAYLEIIQQSTKQIKEIFEFIAKQDGGVLFHCAVGKDRTGVIAMLLLGLAGVERADIITNYMMTEIYIHENPMIRAFPERIPYEVPEELLQSKPEFIIPTLDFITKEYATFENYLTSIGISKDTLSNVFEEFVTSYSRNQLFAQKR